MAGVHNALYFVSNVLKALDVFARPMICSVLCASAIIFSIVLDQAALRDPLVTETRCGTYGMLLKARVSKMTDPLCKQDEGTRYSRGQLVSGLTSLGEYLSAGLDS